MLTSFPQAIPRWLQRQADDADALLQAFGEWRVTPDHPLAVRVLRGSLRAPCQHRPEHWWAQSDPIVEEDDGPEAGAEAGLIVLVGPTDAPLVLTPRTVLEIEIRKRPSQRIVLGLLIDGQEEAISVRLPLRGEPGACGGWDMFQVSMAPLLDRSSSSRRLTGIIIRTENTPGRQISVRWIHALHHRHLGHRDVFLSSRMWPLGGGRVVGTSFHTTDEATLNSGVSPHQSISL